MTAIQESGWAAKLFSSALFCLWLSLASVTVWFDAGSGRTPMTARTPTSEDAPDRSSSRAGAPDERESPVAEGTKASRHDASLPLRPTPADGAEPDAA